MTEERSNFLTDLIEADLERGLHDTVTTRFPPEPNGYPHIGHAKSICLNHGLAQRFDGTFNLRFDDTNPVAEKDEFVRAITTDVEWLLGLESIANVYWASDYFDQIYGYALELVRKGLAYVDSQSVEEVRENRGDFTTLGTDSPCRTRSIEENLSLFERMRAGEFEDGAHVLRAKIDMAHPNMIMRDPPIYRIKHAAHHNTGDKWCVYPMYDFAHCLEDAIEHVTHSVCTLEFENNREIYDWLIDNVSVPSRPRQYEFARLHLDYTVMSKRKLKRLVEEGLVDGWDDPRMPTISGMRRRGVTPESIRAFCDMIGVAKNNSVVDIGKLEFAIRDDLNHRAPRAFGVVEPLPLELTNVDDGFARSFDAPLWPDGFDRDESRALTLRKNILLDRSDFAEEPPDGWKRLAPGGAVRLRYALAVSCDEVVKDESGKVVGLRGRLLEGEDGPAPNGIVHWLSAADAVAAEFRLYERLFRVAAPDGDSDVDFVSLLNHDSLRIEAGFVEAWAAEQAREGLANRAASGDPCFRFQLERVGYFCADPASTADSLVLNRIVTLKDSWSKRDAPDDVASLRAKKEEERADQAARSAATKRDAADVASDRGPDVRERFDLLVADGVEPSAALPLSASVEHAALVRGLSAFAKDADVVAKLFLNLHAPALSAGAEASASEFDRLALDVVADRWSGAEVKKLHARLLESGSYEPDAIERAEGGEVEAAVAKVLAENADAVSRFREGKASLLGFFIGRTMAATAGSADAGAVRAALLKALNA